MIDLRYVLVEVKKQKSPHREGIISTAKRLKNSAINSQRDYRVFDLKTGKMDEQPIK